MVSGQFHYTKRNVFMPFLLVEILNFQGSAHLRGVGSLSYCYKTFFRVMVLSKMGLTEKLIRNRLLFDRKFVAFYQMLFGLKILKEDSHTDTGDFDDLMW